jgi:GNAT superfamily N-acetyltransferase
LLGEFASSQTVGWLAQTAGQPAGFILLGPDLAGPLRRASGGRNPLWRLWLAAASRRPVSAGRVLLAAVAPAWRRQGIGRLLWQQALATARAQGWHTLTAGPVPDDSAGAHFLAACGAKPQQRYAVYASEP